MTQSLIKILWNKVLVVLHYTVWKKVFRFQKVKKIVNVCSIIDKIMMMKQNFQNIWFRVIVMPRWNFLRNMMIAMKLISEIFSLSSFVKLKKKTCIRNRYCIYLKMNKKYEHFYKTDIIHFFFFVQKSFICRDSGTGSQS